MQCRKGNRFKGSTVLLTLAVVQCVSTQLLLFDGWSAIVAHATQVTQSSSNVPSAPAMQQLRIATCSCSRVSHPTILEKSAAGTSAVSLTKLQPPTRRQKS
jgi:hypothetical protein